MSLKRAAQLAGIAAILALSGTASAADDPRLLESRSITKFLGSRLQADLKEAISTGGPVAAINVCKDAAPHIAAELSRMSGAKVSRTSLRFRNPRNAPEAWQAVILEEFDARLKSAESTASLEHFEVAADSSARFMKAIPTGPVCLVCHGSDLAPEVRAVLDEHYPYDRARGYELGEIRGAFSINWPAPVED
ncbi:MAG: DUF3365 domain-containing protein [Gammaproteobacteria bacterium]|nr:MAG: DUF3365 domain-containing protein [Gammaproteobacteria bacterium]